MCIFCILNGKGATMISIQSSMHVYDEILERQRLADILFVVVNFISSSLLSSSSIFI